MKSFAPGPSSATFHRCRSLTGFTCKLSLTSYCANYRRQSKAIRKLHDRHRMRKKRMRMWTWDELTKRTKRRKRLSKAIRKQQNLLRQMRRHFFGWGFSTIVNRIWGPRKKHFKGPKRCIKPLAIL